MNWCCDLVPVVPTRRCLQQHLGPGHRAGARPAEPLPSAPRGHVREEASHVDGPPPLLETIEDRAPTCRYSVSSSRAFSPNVVPADRDRPARVPASDHHQTTSRPRNGGQRRSLTVNSGQPKPEPDLGKRRQSGVPAIESRAFTRQKSAVRSCHRPPRRLPWSGTYCRIAGTARDLPVLSVRPRADHKRLFPRGVVTLG